MGSFAGSSPWGDISGKIGNTVYVRTPNGVVARPYVIPRNPKTPLQQDQRARFRRASQAWGTLDDTARAAWADYARTQKKLNRRTHQWVAPLAHPLFIKLYSKLLAIDFNAAPPQVPPARAFGGDNLNISVSAGAGELVWASTNANREGITTELLIQPLVNAHYRTYEERYRPSGFHTFNQIPHPATTPVKPGCYAVAVRYVDVSTGQCTRPVELGKVQV